MPQYTYSQLQEKYLELREENRKLKEALEFFQILTPKDIDKLIEGLDKAIAITLSKK